MRREKLPRDVIAGGRWKTLPWGLNQGLEVKEGMVIRESYGINIIGRGIFRGGKPSPSDRLCCPAKFSKERSGILSIVSSHTYGRSSAQWRRHSKTTSFQTPDARDDPSSIQ